MKALFLLITLVLASLSCTMKPGESTGSSDSARVDTLAAASIIDDPNAAYVVETIEFKDPDGNTNQIPHVRRKTGNAFVESEINKKILEFFDIASFDPAAEEFFNWYNVSFIAEVGARALALKISATYVGAYPTDVEEVMLISLADGQPITNAAITLPALFKVDGFFPFMEKYWVPVAQPKFQEALECAESPPGCSMYDIKVGATKNVLILTLESESCYPHAGAACAPSTEATLPLDQAKPYLSDFGLKVLESGYFQEQSALRRYDMADQLRASMPAVLFMRVKKPDLTAENDVVRGIGFVYPEASIAVEFNRAGSSLIGYFDMDNLPEDFQSTDSFTLTDRQINFTGMFNEAGFFMERECEGDDGGECEIKLTLNDEYSEGAAMFGKRWLSCDYGTVLYAGSSDVEFFDRQVAEEDRN